MKKQELSLLRAEELSKTYRTGSISHTAVKGVSLEIKKGDFISIIGPSGSGKSSLLYLLAGIRKPDAGRLFFREKNICDMSEKQLAEYRGRETGFVYQDSRLMGDLNILCNVSLPGYLFGGRKEVDERSVAWLKVLGLDSQKNKFPEELSGGQRQKAAIARALMNNPGLLFLDEPTGSLDMASGQQILHLLLRINEKGQSIVMVTHDIGAAARGNQVLVIRDGQICKILDLGRYREETREEREQLIYQEAGRGKV